MKFTYRVSRIWGHSAAFEPSDICTSKRAFGELGKFAQVHRLCVDPRTLLENLPTLCAIQQVVAHAGEDRAGGEVAERSNHIWRTDAS